VAYTFAMNISILVPNSPPGLLDLSTIHWMVTITFLIQGLVVAFHYGLVKRYRGLRMFLASTLVLAFGSALQAAGRWFPLDLVGVGSSLFLLWGTALQYGALIRFAGREASKVLLWGFAGAGTGVLLAVGLIPGPTPFVAIREILEVPLLFGAALAFRKTQIGDYRTGAILTTVPFAGYGVLSVIRVVRGLINPEQMLPGPNIQNDFDALFYYVFSFLWTAGYLLMVNQRLQGELRALATRDPLTNCLNRRAMHDLLAQEQDRLVRYNRPFSIILLDLDRFKTINDTQGHGVGDQVLVQTSQMFQRALRAGDQLARWGGEEFLIVLPETELDQATALANRLRLEVAGHAFEMKDLGVTFSAGVAQARVDQSVDELCRRADFALYDAKETRNNVVTAR